VPAIGKFEGQSEEDGDENESEAAHGVRRSSG
jgi:hypothetical protein